MTFNEYQEAISEFDKNHPHYQTIGIAIADIIGSPWIVISVLSKIGYFPDSIIYEITHFKIFPFLSSLLVIGAFSAFLLILIVFLGPVFQAYLIYRKRRKENEY